MVINLFNLREIDKMNTYKPNLDDKEESYKRSYGEANQFYKEILLYLNDDLFMLFADYMDGLKYYYFELDKELSEQANLKYYKL